MARVTVVQARRKLARLVNRAAFGDERIVLTRYGEDIAGLVSIEDLRRLEGFEDLEDAAEARRILDDPTQTPIRYQRARRDLGLTQSGPERLDAGYRVNARAAREAWLPAWRVLTGLEGHASRARRHAMARASTGSRSQ